MRLIIKFNKKEKIRYAQQQLQGFIYSLLNKAGYSSFHDIHQKLPRFFNFSQLFLGKDGYLTLVISSPINDLIKSLFKSINKKEIFRIANDFLEILAVSFYDYYLSSNKQIIKIKTETPIVVRIPREKYDDYLLPQNFSKYPYFYWRPLKGVPFEPFVKQLEARIYKEYKLFAGKANIKEFPIFYTFRYIKTLDVPFFEKGKKISRPGTMWEFTLNPALNKKLTKFIIDTGLGELNSQGYGFVNVVQK